MNVPHPAFASSSELQQLMSDLVASVSYRDHRGTLEGALQKALAYSIDAKVKAQLSAVLDGMGEAFCALDRDWRFTFVTQAAADLFGRARESMLGRPLWECLTGGQHEVLRAQGELAMRSGEPACLRTNAIGAAGHSTELRLFRHEDGIGIGLQDLAGCHACETALRADETRLRLAIDAAEVGVWDWDLLTGRITMSDRARALHGLPPTAPVNRDVLCRTVHPEDLPCLLPMMERALNPAIREKIPYEYRVARPDGSFGWVLAHGEVIFGAADGETRALRYVGTIQDVTARREAEEALKESEARLSALADNMPLGMVFQITMSRQREGRRFAYVSQNCLQVNGLAPEEAMEDPANLDGLVLPEDLPRLIVAEAEALRGLKPMDVEVRMRHAITGDVRWFQIISAPRTLANGWLVWDGIQNDITERKRVEEHQKLLINELNHRVKNTLAIVQSLAAQSFQRIPPDPDSLAAARRAFEARLLALARGHDVLTRENWEGASLRDVIGEAFAAYRKLHSGESDAVEIEGPDLWVTPAAALSFSMALHELCTNALKYGALGVPEGRVRITWSVPVSPSSGQRLVMRWEEHGGPPVTPPTRKGFGSRLIQDGLARELHGTVGLAYEPTGVVCTIDVPLP